MDYLDALFAVLIEQTKEPSESATVCLDDLLKLRGLQMNPHDNGWRNGFTQKLRNQVLAKIERMMHYLRSHDWSLRITSV